MIEAQSKQNKLGWNYLWVELVRRTKKPATHPSFVIYFVIAVVTIGAMGFWIELIKYLLNSVVPMSALRASVMTFFPVLAATTCLHVIWAENLRMLRAFFVLILVICLIGLAICAIPAISDFIALYMGIFFSFVSLWMWWITNADQDGLLDLINIAAPVGGDDLDAPLSGDVNLNNFKH